MDGVLHGASVAFSGVTTDSRAVDAGDLFIALRGERFDGHRYVGEALGRGAVAALTSRRVDTSLPAPQVVVDDTRLALGRLAAHWRGRFAIPVVALTGSNGKTTVKEMLAAILAQHAGSPDSVLATRGNLNNDIGVPLMALRLRAEHRWCVLELGMNHAGEIARLSEGEYVQLSQTGDMVAVSTPYDEEIAATPLGVCLARLARETSFPPFEGEPARIELRVRAEE